MFQQMMEYHIGDYIIEDYNFSLTDRLSLLLSWLACMGEASCYVEEAWVERTWGWSPANSQRRISSFSSSAHEELRTSILQPMRRWRLPKIMYKFGSRSFPIQTFRWNPSLEQHLNFRPVRNLKQKTQLSHTHFPGPQKLCCFKPLFVLICYTAVDD